MTFLTLEHVVAQQVRAWLRVPTHPLHSIQSGKAELALPYGVVQRMSLSNVSSFCYSKYDPNFKKYSHKYLRDNKELLMEYKILP